MTEVAHARPGFFQSVALALRHYADFEGRATRSEFWWFVLFNALVLSLCGVFDFVVLTPSVTLGSVLATIFSIVTLLPLLAVGVRRLRDSGDNWRHIFWLLVPVGGIIILVFYWIRPTQPDVSEETGRWML